MENKKIETIRINEKLSLELEGVPKGISYANWLLDKIERLNVHEQNANCWIVSRYNFSSNRMSVGDENGDHPIFDEIIEIVFKIPRTNMSNEKRDKGWLGMDNDCNSYANGGFASIESARTYIIKYMAGRLIDNEELLKNKYSYDYEEKMEIYTTAEFDEYYFVADWFDVDMPNVADLTDEQIEELAEQEIKKANEQGIGLLNDVEEYLLKLRDSK